jgi:hypothetical protein
MNEATPTPEEMVGQLLAAGWKRWRRMPTVWQAPWGALFRGPYQAWRIMKGRF